MIEVRQRAVYYSPSRGRAYLTRKAAIRAEAIARIKRKYPTEAASAEDCDPGWHWSQLGHANKLLDLNPKERDA